MGFFANVWRAPIMSFEVDARGRMEGRVTEDAFMSLRENVLRTLLDEGGGCSGCVGCEASRWW